MATLTTEQRSRFTPEQLAYIDKLPDIVGTAAEQDAVVAKWVSKSLEQYRAKACLGSISWASGGATITWSGQSDLSADEERAIEDLLVSGRKYEDVVLEVLAGKRSVEQRLATLEG